MVQWIASSYECAQVTVVAILVTRGHPMTFLEEVSFRCLTRFIFSKVILMVCEELVEWMSMFFFMPEYMA